MGKEILRVLERGHERREHFTENSPPKYRRVNLERKSVKEGGARCRCYRKWPAKKPAGKPWAEIIKEPLKAKGEPKTILKIPLILSKRFFAPLRLCASPIRLQPGWVGQMHCHRKTPWPTADTIQIILSLLTFFPCAPLRSYSVQ